MLNRQPWQEQAACRKLSPEEADNIFFTDAAKKASKRAAFLCGNCPVTRECLNFALLYNERGVWAETTVGERREMLGLVDRQYLQMVAQASGFLENRQIDYGPLPSQEVRLQAAQLVAPQSFFQSESIAR